MDKETRKQIEVAAKQASDTEVAMELGTLRTQLSQQGQQQMDQQPYNQQWQQTQQIQ